MKFPTGIPVYGDIGFRGPCPPESAEQKTFFAWLRLQYPHTLGKIAFHPRNEGQRTASQARYQKAEGLTPGASDIVIPIGPRPILIELKQQNHTKSRLSDNELHYLISAQSQGAFVAIALGWEGAKDAVLDATR